MRRDYIFFRFKTHCSYGLEVPCHLCIILAHGWLFFFSPPYKKLHGLRWWFVTAGVTFWQQYQRQEPSPRVLAWVFALQWHSMITCQPSSQDCSESSSPGNSESINTSCPCLLSGSMLFPYCTKPMSPTPLLTFQATPLKTPDRRTLFPRALKCFALPFHHGSNELVPVAALLLLWLVLN